MMIVLIRGGGDLASGVAYRLVRAGLKVVMTELPQPLAVRRLVSFAQAVFSGEVTIEGITARRVSDAQDTLRMLQILSKGQVPVLIDPPATSALALHPSVIIDARLTKHPPEPLKHQAQLYIGLGPGFTAGKDCHAVIETNRGHRLGRVIWQGTAEPDTGLPERVLGRHAERVLRSPSAGILEAQVEIGAHVTAGQALASVSGQVIHAPFEGNLRGLLYPGLPVEPGQKIGDLDPRLDPAFCTQISDKALAIGGGILEAILSRQDLRANLWK